MATKLKVNYELVGDSNIPVTRTESIKHGNDMLNSVINAAVSTAHGKADKTYVDTELGKKADKSEVNGKADASTVAALQTAVNGKADSSTVSALSERVSTNETNIAVANARINEIVAIPPGSTEGNTELIDIRIGADGKEYSTAGDAVRGQVTDLKSDLSGLNTKTDNLYLMPHYGLKTLTSGWESGYIKNDGTDAPSAYGWRTKDFYDFTDVKPSIDKKTSFSIKMNEEYANIYDIVIIVYNKSGVWVNTLSRKSGVELNNMIIMNSIGEEKLVRVYLLKHDNSTISNIENANDIIIVNKTTPSNANVKDTDEFKQEIISEISESSGFDKASLYGKKWCVIGDSITAVNTAANKHYHDLIAEEYNMSVQNKGSSGTGYKVTSPFYDRVPSIDDDCDLITVFGGVNDVILTNYEIGNETDTTTDSICGCVNVFLDVIENKFKERVPIGIISPLPCEVNISYIPDAINPSQRPNDLNCRMSQFVSKLEQICKLRGYPFLDLYHTSGFRPWVAECNNKYFKRDSFASGDGLHPNDNGHKILVNKITMFLTGLSN